MTNQMFKKINTELETQNIKIHLNRVYLEEIIHLYIIIYIEEIILTITLYKIC